MHFKLIKFEKPTQINKKYSALVLIKGKVKRVNFGDKRYQQYRDSTPLKLYTRLNHNDKERKRLYLIRHRSDNGVAGVLSRKYLWT